MRFVSHERDPPEKTDQPRQPCNLCIGRGWLNCGLYIFNLPINCHGHVTIIWARTLFYEANHLGTFKEDPNESSPSCDLRAFLPHGFWAILNQWAHSSFLSASWVKDWSWHVFSWDWPSVIQKYIIINFRSALGASEVCSDAKCGAIIGNNHGVQ